MTKIMVTESDTWVMNVSEDELNDLKNCNVSLAGLLESKRGTDDLTWKNGSIEWD